MYVGVTDYKVPSSYLPDIGPTSWEISLSSNCWTLHDEKSSQSESEGVILVLACSFLMPSDCICSPYVVLTDCPRPFVLSQLGTPHIFRPFPMLEVRVTASSTLCVYLRGLIPTVLPSAPPSPSVPLFIHYFVHLFHPTIHSSVHCESQGKLDRADGVLFHAPTHQRKEFPTWKKPDNVQYILMNLEPVTYSKIQPLLRDKDVRILSMSPLYL